MEPVEEELVRFGNHEFTLVRNNSEIIPRDADRMWLEVGTQGTVRLHMSSQHVPEADDKLVETSFVASGIMANPYAKRGLFFFHEQGNIYAKRAQKIRRSAYSTLTRPSSRRLSPSAARKQNQCCEYEAHCVIHTRIGSARRVCTSF